MLSSSINLAKDPGVKSIPTKCSLKLVTKSDTFKTLLDSIDRFLSDYTSLSKVDMITNMDKQEKHADVFKINQKQYLFSGLSHVEMVMFLYF